MQGARASYPRSYPRTIHGLGQSVAEFRLAPEHIFIEENWSSAEFGDFRKSPLWMTLSPPWSEYPYGSAGRQIVKPHVRRHDRQKPVRAPIRRRAQSLIAYPR